MSGSKFVRASKYRHVFGADAKKENQFQNIRPNMDGEGNYIVANTKFLAVSLSGGGGPVLVHPLDQPGRLSHNPFKINVHKQKVVDCDFNPFVPNLIATASEDCSVRLTLFPEAGLTANIEEATSILEGHQKKLALLKFHPTANNVLSSSGYDYVVKTWDIEKNAELFSCGDHGDMIQSMDWNVDGSQLVTACKDKFVRIYDPRKPDAAIAKVEGFPGTRSSRAIWLTNKNKIAVFGFNKQAVRQYAVIDPRDTTKMLAVTDIDQAAGVNMPFYDADTSMIYVGGKGDAGIKYYEVVDEEPFIHFLSEYRSTESQKGLTFLPKLACDYKTCEVAVGLRLLRDSIVPVSFQVPRKSDVFQKDIYPDTYAGVPSCTADEWKGGVDKAPVLRPVKDDATHKAAASIQFKAAKSAAQLQQELDAALKTIAEQEKKIKELEAKIKAAN